MKMRFDWISQLTKLFPSHLCPLLCECDIPISCHLTKNWHVLQIFRKNEVFHGLLFLYIFVGNLMVLNAERTDRVLTASELSCRYCLHLCVVVNSWVWRWCLWVSLSCLAVTGRRVSVLGGGSWWRRGVTPPVVAATRTHSPTPTPMVGWGPPATRPWPRLAPSISPTTPFPHTALLAVSEN